MIDIGAFQFVAAPFLPTHQPALGVSSLVAVLRKNEFPASVNYLNVAFGSEIGWDLSWAIEANFSKDLLIGDMIFARALWGDQAPCWSVYRGYLLEFLSPKAESVGTLPLRRFVDLLGDLYDRAPDIVTRWTENILATRPRVVGFTSTFQQNVCSLALAKQLRASTSSDETLIVFGGANCEGDMGRAMSESFDFIDHVVSGEGEEVIVDIARGVYEGDSRRISLPRYVIGKSITDMNALPIPDFSAYFAAIKGVPWEKSANLVAESSRGCWWGMKSHCTFCGLNGNTMAFRSKDAARFADELELLRLKYGKSSFLLSDNIMDLGYLKDLFPILVRDQEGFQLFYETKANLRKDQLEVMAAAGVGHIQPGIESLSSEVLHIMGKGTTKLQNLQLLKWCREFNVQVSWSLLYGFPHELAANYEEMAKLLPSVVHLPPPSGHFRVRLDRFSPYWMHPDRYGIKNVRPTIGYGLIYPNIDEDQRARLAYFFDYDYADNRQPYNDYFSEVAREIDLWRLANARGAQLELVSQNGTTYVKDTRTFSHDRLTPVTPEEVSLLRILDSKVSSKSARHRIGSLYPGMSDADVSSAFQMFCDQAWVVEEGEQMLSIVMDPGERERVIDRLVSEKLEYLGFSSP